MIFPVIEFGFVQPDYILFPAEPGKLPFRKMSGFPFDHIHRFLKGAAAVQIIYGLALIEGDYISMILKKSNMMTAAI